jgi:hypothetical protein
MDAYFLLGILIIACVCLWIDRGITKGKTE